MSKNKAEKKHGFRFLSSIVTCVFAVLAVIAYIVGTSYFGYYDDLNLGIVLLIAAGAVLCMASAVLIDRTGKNTVPSLLTIAASVLLTVSLMMILSARVYSFAVLILSDLERDNLEGYYALYTSIGAAGLLTMGIISNMVTAFVRGFVKKDKVQA
ncbi:hypothetical protein B5F07_03200 [Lachnoclostridium sp. An169]|uniref:hypothetical protein n=1 Tax=Lachnoclostridium sp. An169 TaxID=1965569 RepID=UPI000B38B422|nr:hypothetical protein [Lachnoclostridium sp. An169]OUP85693.1 hypothetical protein B5F07_03200 [Lachnoclostridium sp. An169]